MQTVFDQSKPLAIGSDHAGFEFKKKLIPILESQGWTVKDYGTNGPDSVDYPDYAHPVAQAVNDEVSPVGILICGSGNGVCMTANKHPHVRAALVWNEELAHLARQHNNANIICLPERFVPFETALEMVDAFLTTAFEGGRHERRVEKI